MVKVLIGIDDTDNKESRGTGFNSRELAKAIEDQGLGKVFGITRHQLYIHDDIPYTSQNSSACLDVATESMEDLIVFCTQFMTDIGAIGSDVGLCITRQEGIGEEVLHWGRQAKSVVLSMDAARAIASKEGIVLKGLTGTRVGIIGALAAVGLRAGGNDGRFIWIQSKKNLRDIEHGVKTVDYLCNYAGINKVQPIENEIVKPEDRVFLNDWARPVLKNHNSVLVVERNYNNKDYEWRCATKAYIKSLSN